jgi:RND family efflux transporter MFP subunit
MVSTANPRRAPAVVDLPLPGSMEAILETGIWARTNGYLQARYVDIGDHVNRGQLLADIDTPEVDQQLMQAIATMHQDKANVAKFEADLALARTTYQRYVVAGPGTVSKQQIDERISAVTDAERVVDAGRATVNADDANVRRLLELQSFQKVYAPFDGVITVRNVDPGSLITAGSTTGTTELFTLAQVDVLRIFVFVPQSYAPDIKVGQTADVSVRELPGRVFKGTVARTAGAIDATSRTLLTEGARAEPDGLLLSGSYATVRFKVQRPDRPSSSRRRPPDRRQWRCVAVVSTDGAATVRSDRPRPGTAWRYSPVDTTDIARHGAGGERRGRQPGRVAKPTRHRRSEAMTSRAPIAALVLLCGRMHGRTELPPPGRVTPRPS